MFSSQRLQRSCDRYYFLKMATTVPFTLCALLQTDCATLSQSDLRTFWLRECSRSNIMGLLRQVPKKPYGFYLCLLEHLCACHGMRVQAHGETTWRCCVWRLQLNFLLAGQHQLLVVWEWVVLDVYLSLSEDKSNINYSVY